MLLVVAVLGMAVALLFDLLRVWRRVARPGRLWAHLADAAYAIVVGLLLAAGLLFINWFQIRTFVFLGLLIGAFLYFDLASPFVVAALTGLVAFALRALRAVARAGLALRERVAVSARDRAIGVRVRLAPRAHRVRRWGGDLARRMATWWRRFPGFLN